MTARPGSPLGAAGPVHFRETLKNPLRSAKDQTVQLNTRNFYVRCLLAGIAALFTPAGIMVLRGAFGEEGQPHLFVMLVFSGSLTLLLGLVGLIGFVASFVSKGASADKTSDE